MFPNQWQSTSSWNTSSIHHTNNVIVLFVVEHILQHLSAWSGIETYKIIIIFQNYPFSELIVRVCVRARMHASVYNLDYTVIFVW